jgi:hypothetical protein
MRPAKGEFLRGDVGRAVIVPGHLPVKIHAAPAVENGWRSVASQLTKHAHHALANDVRGFADGMPPVRTDRELLGHELRQRLPDPRIRHQDPTR